jgi:hypothetical protein
MIGLLRIKKLAGLPEFWSGRSVVRLGSKACCGIASAFTGNIPISLKPDWAVSTDAVLFHAGTKSSKNSLLSGFFPPLCHMKLRPRSVQLCFKLLKKILSAG